VGQAYNPSYSGGRDQEDHGLRPAQVKSSQDSMSTNEKLGMVACVCHPSYAGRINTPTYYIAVQADLGINMRLFIINN
jgi:hypothetical protein